MDKKKKKEKREGEIGFVREPRCRERASTIYALLTLTHSLSHEFRLPATSGKVRHATGKLVRDVKGICSNSKAVCSF